MLSFTLSQEQSEAAISDSSRLMIIAPPGCGKTEILAHRAGYLVDSLEDNQRVLALTFTNRARSNLDDRLRAVLGQVRTRRFVDVRNFHGFAAHVVLAHGRTIGMTMEDLQMPKTTTLRKAMVAAGGSGSQMYEAECILGEIKRRPYTDAEIFNVLQQQPPSPALKLAEEVELERQEKNQLHYDDLLRHAQRLLRVPGVARLYQAHYGAVLVDEFQDLSLQQLDVARLSCASSQTFAGDPLQGIYSWAGADPTEVEIELRKDCTKIIHLHESYRSSPKVLAAVNSVSEKIDPRSTLISAQPERWMDQGCSASLVLQDRTQEAEVVRGLAAKILSHDSNASVGIICRAGWRRECIDREFANETRFPVRRWEVSIEDPKIVELIQSAIALLPRGASIEDARIATLDNIDLADVETRERVDEAFDTLGKSDSGTARSAIRSIRSSDASRTIDPGVHLLNAHSGKGQQFDWAFVIGLEEGHLPDRRNSSGDKLAEEQRVLVVMLSRARHGLVATRAEMTSGKYGPYKAKESRWWSGVETEFTSVEDIERHLSAKTVES